VYNVRGSMYSDAAERRLYGQLTAKQCCPQAARADDVAIALIVVHVVSVLCASSNGCELLSFKSYG